MDPFECQNCQRLHKLFYLLLKESRTYPHLTGSVGREGNYSRNKLLLETHCSSKQLQLFYSWRKNLDSRTHNACQSVYQITFCYIQAPHALNHAATCSAICPSAWLPTCFIFFIFALTFALTTKVAIVLVKFPEAIAINSSPHTTICTPT